MNRPYSCRLNSVREWIGRVELARAFARLQHRTFACARVALLLPGDMPKGSAARLFGWLALMALAVPHSSAATIFESSTLGPTGILRSQVTGGSNVGPFVFVGVRFHLEQSALTTHIGGHFVKNNAADQSLFGSLIALADANDFPDSGDLSTPDVVGTTSLSFPEPSNEVYGVISERLALGWYALVFGSGLFGATGSGVAINNGLDIGERAYIAFQPGPGLGWSNLEGFLTNFRFVVKGDVIPEPPSVTITAFGFLSFLFGRRLRHLGRCKSS